MVLQEPLSFALKEALPKVGEESFSPILSFYCGTGELAEQAIKKTDVHRGIINFLCRPESRRSAEELSDILNFKTVATDLLISRERMIGELTLAHRAFWGLPMEGRALVAAKLLFPDGGASSKQERAWGENFALNYAFPLNMEHAREARSFVKDYLEALPDYSRDLALAAIFTSAMRGAEANKGASFRIALFLESMGPAETKVGQVASSHPKVPKSFRDDLSRLKSSADEPPRWELFELIKRNCPPQVISRIKRVNKILGSASLFVATSVSMHDYGDVVLSLLRPHAQARAEFGFANMTKLCMNKESRRDDAYGVVGELAIEAGKLTANEVNTRLVQPQRDFMRPLYAARPVKIDGEEFNFVVPQVLEVGAQYVISEQIMGDHFTDLKGNEDGQRAYRLKLAAAIVAKELSLIFAADRFDTDRHGGNFRSLGTVIGHFDLGGVNLELPEEESIAELGKVLGGAILNCSSPAQLGDAFFQQVANLHETGQLSPLVKRVQKAIASLGEYINEINEQDPALLAHVFSAAIPFAHPKLKEGVLESVAARLTTGAAIPAWTEGLLQENANPRVVFV